MPKAFILLVTVISTALASPAHGASPKLSRAQGKSAPHELHNIFDLIDKKKTKRGINLSPARSASMPKKVQGMTKVESKVSFKAKMKPTPEAYLEQIDLSPYKLQFGDSVEITVMGEPDMTRIVKIGPDGRITYLLAGEMMVVGKTFKEVEKWLKSRLTKYFKDPRVSVIGTSYAGSSVIVLGKVSSPGRVEVSRNSRVLDALAKAGGLLAVEGSIEEAANIKNAYLSRGGTILEVDFIELLEKGNMAHNILVKPDDFLYIPPAHDNKIFMLGEINAPGIVRFNNKISLLEAVATAGGISTKGWRYKIFLMKGGIKDKSPTAINFHKIVLGKSPNIDLDSGDVVYVPPSLLTRLERVSQQATTLFNGILSGDSLDKTVIRPPNP